MAILFDGDDYLQKDYSGTGPISSYPFTMAAWFKAPQDRSADWQGFVLSDGSETNRYGMGPARYGRWAIYRITVEKRTSGTYYSDTSENDWRHSTAVFNAQNSRELFLDGSSVMTDGGNIGSTTLTDADIVGIGYGPTNSANALYKGNMAECGLWSVALTAAEISALSAGFSPLLIRPGSLVGYWPLGGAYPDYSDQVGSSTLSATGDPTPSSHPPIIHPSIPVVVKESAAEPVTADGSVSEYLRTPDTSGSFTKPYDTSSTYSRDTDTTGTFTRPSE